MLKLGFGFLLGVVFTFYSFSFVQSVLGQAGLVKEKVNATFEQDEPIYTLNPNPPISLTREQKYSIQDKHQAELSRILKAVSISKSSPQHLPASRFVIEVITDFVKMNPDLGYFMRQRIEGGLTNQEALQVFDQYLASKTAHTSRH